MRTLVYHGPKNVSVDDVPDARIERLTYALIKITTTNICGSDLLVEAVEATPIADSEGDAVQYNRQLRILIHRDKLNPGLIVSQELNPDEAAEGYQRFDDRGGRLDQGPATPVTLAHASPTKGVAQ